MRSEVLGGVKQRKSSKVVLKMRIRKIHPPMKHRK